MKMTYNQIIHILTRLGIVNNGKIRRPSLIKKLVIDHPELVQYILEATSFIVVDTDIAMRILYILKDITYQSTCKQCGAPISMIMQGRDRGTFPIYCSRDCMKLDKNTIKQKQLNTIISKYGSLEKFIQGREYRRQQTNKQKSIN